MFPAPKVSGRLDVEPLYLTVSDMVRSLDFYLDVVGCEVRFAADGWAMLGCGETCFVLVDAATPGPGWRTRSHPDQPASASTPPIRISTPDLRALRRRLLVAGICAEVITGSARATGGEIATTDPDRYRVVIEQRCPDPADVAPAHPLDSSSARHGVPSAIP